MILATLPPGLAAVRRWEGLMKRREFLQSMTAVAAGSLLPAPAVWSLLVRPLRVLNGRGCRYAGLRGNGWGRLGSGSRRGIALF